MNCCDYECNQGRNCPARGAKVARIGRKDYAREPLSRSPWRVYLRHLAKWMLICIAMLFAAAFVVGVLHA